MPTDADSARAPEPRPLPANPSLEFERKRAKKLLRAMRETNPAVKLTDAQFAIAREYGFLGWPLLVQYFQALERQRRSDRRMEGLPQQHADSRLESVLRQHQSRVPAVGLSLAAWVPRFYGRSPEEALNTPITADEARLVVARQNGATSWEALLAAGKTREQYAAEEWQSKPPLHLASEAVFAGDLAAMEQVCVDHPEVLRDDGQGWSLLQQALFNEYRIATPKAAAATAWLVHRGGDLKTAATRNLVGAFMLSIALRMRPGADLEPGRVEDYIEFLLARGADPSWVAPSGLSILELGLINYWSGAAVDVIARRVTPPKAFWIAAGLGDVREVRRYFAPDGSLRPAARRRRPDFAAAGRGFPPSAPGASDAYIIFETAFIALVNQRFDVVDVLVEHGFDPDADYGDMTLLGVFAANPMVEIVEYLISRGANPQKRGRHPASTALEHAEYLLKRPALHPEVARDVRRIYELCGGSDPDAVTRQYEDRTVAPAVLWPDVVTSLGRARGDAAALGHATVEPFDLFISLLRDGAMVPHLVRGAGTDMAALRRAIGERLERTPPIPPVPEPRVGATLQAAIDAALADATRRKASHVTALALVVQLVADAEGEPARLIAGAGGSLAKLRASLGGYEAAYRD